VAKLERAFIIERTNLALGSIKKKLEKGKGHLSKSGRVINSIGRPKDSKDEKSRRKSGYYQRWTK